MRRLLTFFKKNHKPKLGRKGAILQRMQDRIVENGMHLLEIQGVWSVYQDYLLRYVCCFGQVQPSDGALCTFGWHEYVWNYLQQSTKVKDL